MEKDLLLRYIFLVNHRERFWQESETYENITIEMKSLEDKLLGGNINE